MSNFAEDKYAFPLFWSLGPMNIVLWSMANGFQTRSRMKWFLIPLGVEIQSSPFKLSKSAFNFRFVHNQ